MTGSSSRCMSHPMSGSKFRENGSRMCRAGRVLLLLLLQHTGITLAVEDDANYLENTINGLKQNLDIDTDPTGITRKIPSLPFTTPDPVRRADQPAQKTPPPLHLTKSELAALYQNAVAKGESIKLSPGDVGASHINAAVHELAEPSGDKANDKDSGYYYYYYPLKSFMEELTSSGNKHGSVKYEEYHQHKPVVHEEELKPQVHSHMHQHNIRIQHEKNMMDMDKKSKGLEPLFMAISGFIGMTIMFILSILVLPKFEKLKPKGFKSEPEEFTSMARIAMQAIEGRNCEERLSCEMGKTAMAFNIHDNRFIKLLRRVAPVFILRKIDKIRKYADKKFKCAAIPCKRKEKPAQNGKPDKKKARAL